MPENTRSLAFEVKPMSDEITILNHTPTPMLGAESDARLIDLWLHGRSPATQRSYRAEAERFVANVSKRLDLVSLADLQGWANQLEASRLKPATRRRLLASIKSLFSFGHRLG